MSELKIDELIVSYAENKSEMNSYKKISDKQNAEIKAYMRENELLEKEAGNYIATYKVESRESINEDILLEQLKNCQYLPEGIIKTKEYVDMDALETAVYNGKLTKETVVSLDKARIVKPVEVLRIKKVKKNEKRNKSVD